MNFFYRFGFLFYHKWNLLMLLFIDETSGGARKFFWGEIKYNKIIELKKIPDPIKVFIL